MKHRICVGARVISCIAFLMLTIIGVSSLVRAMTLESVANNNGIPTAWKVASLGHPDTINVPITYWDQRQDECNDVNRQFEWSICQYWTAGALQGVVRDTLGSDGLPIPTYETAEDAWAANHDIFTANVTGHNPVRATDNFYRWFHNTEVSQQFDREITFKRVGENNTYTYGGSNIFPLDKVDFSSDDTASQSGHSDDGKQHNFHFTAHLSIPMKISADGSELFEFSGDDDVWVFLNGHLVLDIGGLHEALNGNFRINADGTITSYVQNVNDVSDREKLGKPGTWAYNYINNLNNHNRATYQDQTKTFDIGLKAGDVVNLDFFYAERSTTASNTHITISNMNWPISADSDVDGKVVGRIENSASNLVEYQSSVKNRDPSSPLTLQRLSSYIRDNSTTTTENGEEPTTNSGFLPLDVKTLSYTTTPDDQDSWQPVAITMPTNDANGFVLESPLTMQPAGQTGDTLYFRYFAETSPNSGDITNLVAYYTELRGVSGVTWDHVTIPYTTQVIEEPTSKYLVEVEYIKTDTNTEAFPKYSQEHEANTSFTIYPQDLDGYTKDRDEVDITVTDGPVHEVVKYTPKTNPSPDQPDPVDPKPTDPDPIDPKPGDDPDDKSTTPIHPGGPTNTPDDNPSDTPTNPLPILPVIPNGDGDELLFYAPLGEVAYVPNTGVVSDYVAPIFEQYFADAVLSQGFILTALLVFSASFATYFSLRKHLNLNTAPAVRVAKVKQMPKNIGNSLQKSRRKSATKSKSTARTQTAKSKTASKSAARTASTRKSTKK